MWRMEKELRSPEVMRNGFAINCIAWEWHGAEPKGYERKQHSIARTGEETAKRRTEMHRH